MKLRIFCFLLFFSMFTIKAKSEPITPIKIEPFVHSVNGKDAKIVIKGKEAIIPKDTLSNCKTMPGYCQVSLSWLEYQKLRNSLK